MAGNAQLSSDGCVSPLVVAQLRSTFGEQLVDFSHSEFASAIRPLASAMRATQFWLRCSFKSFQRRLCWYKKGRSLLLKSSSLRHPKAAPQRLTSDSTIPISYPPTST
jgi:hypothetical protein